MSIVNNSQNIDYQLFDKKNRYKIYIKLLISLCFITIFTIINFISIPYDTWIINSNITEIQFNASSFLTIFYYTTCTWFSVIFNDIVPSINLARSYVIIMLFIAYSIAFF